MKKWPDKERPRERLREKGPRALGDAELLALLIGTGTEGENAVETARRILESANGVERLAQLGIGGLSRIPGIGTAKASRIVAAVELGVRILERRGNGEHPPGFGCSSEIFTHYHPRLSALKQEIFLAVGLDNKNHPICEVMVAKGTLTECRITPREVFRPMIAEAAARMIVLHNHPSGDPSPSPEDVAVTSRLKKVAELVGIPLLDHIIMGTSSYSSLKDMGLI